MNIIRKLTIRQLRQNKRRTLVTIIGVIISVSMITAVSTLGVSFLDLLQRHTIAKNGLWHALLENASYEQAKQVRQDDAIRSVQLARNIGYAVNEHSDNKYMPYYYIQQMDEAALEQQAIELVQGRMPQAGNEVLASSALLNSGTFGYKVGDTVSLEVGLRYSLPSDQPDAEPLGPLWQSNPYLYDTNKAPQEELRDLRSQSYTIVGIADMPETGYTGYTLLGLLQEEQLADTDLVSIYLVMDKLNNGIYDTVDSLAASAGIKKVEYHNELLRYYMISNADSFRSVMIGLIGTIMLIIVIGSVSLIYNAFAISVADRSRYLGMLASVGATRKQKRSSVFFEGAAISVISIPLGIASGLAGIGATLWYLNSYIGSLFNTLEPLRVHVTAVSLLLAVGVSLFTIFISIYFPARRASRISAIDAIRQSQDIKLTTRAVKTSRLVRSLFGLEAEIGLKNLKRNKGRYKATIFSLVISIVLFMSVSFFSDNFQKSVGMTQSGLEHDFMIYHFAPGGELTLDRLRQMDGVTELSWVRTVYAQTRVPEAKLATPLKRMVQDGDVQLEDGSFSYQAALRALDDDTLAKFAAEQGIETAPLYDTEKPSAIAVNTITYSDGQRGKYVEAQAMELAAGEQLELFYHTEMFSRAGENEAFTVVHSTEMELPSLAITALADSDPFGVRGQSLGSINLIVSEPMMQKLLEQYEGVADSVVMVQSSDPAATERALVELPDNEELAYTNLYSHRQQERQLLIIMNVFCYGFIALISLISVTNILNTISTSIALRKREFAMLRSIGMTPQGFRRMIRYESIFYGLKALLYGIPISAAAMYLMYASLMNGFEYSAVIPWDKLAIAVLAVFLIVGLSMLYASSKVRKENIIDAIKQETI